MQDHAEFDILGSVGRIAKYKDNIKLSIGAKYYQTGADGNPVEQPHWNIVTVIDKTTIAFINKHVRKGDRVSARGKMRQATYEKGGVIYYVIELTAKDFRLLHS